ncbi:MAG: peptide-methionine (R)-S-oxide reductase MsrB [Candidatus Gracilibacteria bacterium]|nr:peptide-methionine (R)-S-oxide reductase MsrB [Candidatus Gracilibacteria bacterium]
MKNIIKIISVLLGIIIIYLGYNYINYNSQVSDTNKKIESTSNLKEAYFAGGCFWCVESSFEKYSNYGILDVVSGYAGGEIPNPTYKKVSSGTTKYREAAKVVYDADLITYNDLLEIFWRTANPTDPDGQYVDRGFQYSSAIFYTNSDEKKIAEASKENLGNSGRFGDKKIITPIIEYTTFYDAEEYHQDFYKKSVRYNVYTNGSGRKEFLDSTWGKDLTYDFNGKGKFNNKKITTDYKGNKLTDLQYEVTQEAGTERSFDNIYWDNKQEGIYVDLIDGTPLYSSLDKYKSGTGWPSFTKPININNILEKEDNTLFSKRTEIIGAKSKSHIGHVFTDGPTDKGGLRYCMNSASLKFIEKDNLEKEGYGEYISLF